MSICSKGKNMNRFFEWLDRVTDWVEMIATCLMVIIIFIQILFRYCFNSALAWPEEIARYLFCWGTYLAVAISMRGDNNLRITILLDALSPKSRKRLNMFCSFINSCFFLVLIYLTGDITLQVRELGEAMISMAVPVWLAWAGLPLCFAVIALQAMRNLYLIATDKIGVPDAKGQVE